MDVPICIIIHHGGKWINKPKLSYVGGNVKLINNVPLDFDRSCLRGLINSLGYNNIVKLHYCDPLKELHQEQVSHPVTIDNDNFVEHLATSGGSFIEDLTIVNLESEQANNGTDDIDYDEEGSDNEDDEVREARKNLQEEMLKETSFEDEVDSLRRLAARRGRVLTKLIQIMMMRVLILTVPQIQRMKMMLVIYYQNQVIERSIRRAKPLSTPMDLSKVAAADLKKRNQKKWVRAFFTTTPHCDCIDNNMNEVFNAYILSSRHKPIITMLEDIREGLMERLQKKRDFISNKDIEICPRIKAKLEKSKMDARGWLAFWDGHFSYGVREGLTQNRYVVSLLAKTCTCNAWQLSGVPCNHAVAAIWKVKELPEHYVSHYFSKNTYLKAYQFPLEPLNGPQEWPQSPYSPVIAPAVKKLQHRPTVKRKPSIGEVTGTRLSKKGVTMKCSKCREAGHNKNKCPMKENIPTAPKAPTKRKQ
ncbi:Type IV secretion system protein virB4, partial [Bienertia sinuspersici]